MDLPRYPELKLGAIEVILRSQTRQQNPTPRTTCRNALNRYDISTESTNGKQKFSKKRTREIEIFGIVQKIGGKGVLRQHG